jgi:hypothetical protein
MYSMGLANMFDEKLICKYKKPLSPLLHSAINSGQQTYVKLYCCSSKLALIKFLTAAYPKQQLQTK